VRIVVTFLLALAALQTPVAPAPQDRDMLVAFRFDSQHVVATVKSDLDVSLPQLARDPVPRPIAKYGYPIFDLPPDLQKRVPSTIRAGDRWTIHTAPGQAFGATAARIVLGEGQCSHLIGVLLKVDDKDAYTFAGVRAKYYAAGAGPRDLDAQPSELGELPASTLTPEVRARIDKTLAALLAKELPAVRRESAEDLGRAGSAGPHRTWARGVLDAQDALARGAGTLTYDAQPYRLTPDGVPSIFVRAIWRAAGRQAFATAVWLRADTGDTLWKNLRPAHWIGMYEFHRGGVHQEQLGLVLNVVDSNGDGWAEIVFAQLGYESVNVTLIDMRSGFAPVGTGYSYGC
jgi:hypothetical protein